MSLTFKGNINTAGTLKGKIVPIPPSPQIHKRYYAGTSANTDVVTGFKPAAVLIRDTQQVSAEPTMHFERTPIADPRIFFTNTSTAGIAQSSGSENVIESFNETGYLLGRDTLGNGGGNTYTALAWEQFTGSFSYLVYTGNGSGTRSVPHDLGVIPEMIWIKSSGSPSWACYVEGMTAGTYVSIDAPGQPLSNTTVYRALPTATDIEIGSDSKVNQNGQLFHTFLWASHEGYQKIGSYTGTGSPQDIDVGFKPDVWFVYSPNDGKWAYMSADLETIPKTVTLDDRLTNYPTTQLSTASGINTNGQYETNAVKYYYMAFKTTS